MNASAARVARAQATTATDCLDLGFRDALPPGLDAQTCLTADLRGRMAQAAGATARVEGASCGTPPDFGFAGAASAIPAAAEASRNVIADVFGPDLGAVPPFGPTCQTSMTRGLRNLMAAGLKEFLLCKKRGLRSGEIASAAGLEACMAALDSGPSRRILAALDGIERDLGRWCAFFDVHDYFPGRCVHHGDLVSCVDDRVRCRACEMLNATDGIQADCELIDDGLANGSCTASCPPEQVDCAGFCNGPFGNDHDGVCCNGSALDSCGFCNGTGFNCGWTQVAVGRAFACGLRTDGSIDCWGGFGPITTPPAGTFTQVVAGGGTLADQHACALASDGTAACWGDNGWGQLDAPGGAFTQLASGRHHVCGLRPDGSVECWGADHVGQASPPASTFTQITCQTDVCCGLHADGSPECWGYGPDGQLDELPGPFSALTASSSVIYALNPDGTVAHWGRDLPQFDPPPGAFTQLAASNVNACGIRPGGAVECWGAELIALPEPGAYVHIAADEQRRYCGVRADGIIFCWDNAFYQSSPPR
jgi:hypothetical protein